MRNLKSQLIQSVVVLASLVDTSGGSFFSLAHGSTESLQVPSRSTCSSAAQESPQPGIKGLFTALRRTERVLTETTLQDTFCEEPQNFCDAVRELSGAEHAVAFGEGETGGTSTESGFLMRESLSTEEGKSLVLDGLRAFSKSTSGTERSVLQSLYEGQSWNRLQNLYSSAQESLIEHLSQKHLSTPPVVIEKLKQLTLLNPFDESVSLGKRKELLASCGLSEGWELSTGNELGDFNAFANVEGFVVVCPQMLLAQNDEGLLTVLIHEIAHQLGPCLVGGALLAQLTKPHCTVDSRVYPQLAPWLDWQGRTKKLEQCFHRAGMNDGTDAAWVSRVLTQEFKKIGDYETLIEGCPRSFAEHLQPSDDPTLGLVSTCDPRQFHLLVQMFSSMERSEIQSKEQKNLRDRARSLKLQLRTLQSNARALVPDTNQFNEAISDVFAAQLLEPALKKNQAKRGQPSHTVTSSPNSVLSGLSALCGAESPWQLKGEAHSRDDRRMSVFASQGSLRRLVGCRNQPPRGLAKRLSQCHGLGL